MNFNRGTNSHNEPSFMGYQLLGDSQLLRFSEQVLKKCRIKSNGAKPSHLGFCVSGQKIEDLLDRVRENELLILDKLVLMIGTNNILQFCSFEDMRGNFENLVLLLIKKGVTKLLLLTIPPIPRLCRSTYHWNTLKKFNEHIKTLHNEEDIFVIDTYPKFIENPTENSISVPLDSHNDNNSVHNSCLISSPCLDGVEDEDDCFTRSHYDPYSDLTCDSLFVAVGDRIKIDLFEKYLDDSNGKRDLIHLNYQGLSIIKQLILNHVNIFQSYS